MCTPTLTSLRENHNHIFFALLNNNETLLDLYISLTHFHWLDWWENREMGITIVNLLISLLSCSITSHHEICKYYPQQLSLQWVQRPGTSFHSRTRFRRLQGGHRARKAEHWQPRLLQTRIKEKHHSHSPTPSRPHHSERDPVFAWLR